MTTLEFVLEKLRALPEKRQEELAQRLLGLIETESDSDSLLSDEQWADLRKRMAEPQGESIPHEDIVAEFERKFGR